MQRTAHEAGLDDDDDTGETKRAAKQVKTSVDPDLTANLRQTYHRHAKALSAQAPTVADLFIYPPIIIDTTAEALTSVMRDATRAVRAALRSAFDEEQESNHRKRMTTLLRNEAELQQRLNATTVEGVTLLLTLTGTYLTQDATINETILRLQTWSPQAETNDEIRGLLERQPAIVNVIRESVAAFNTSWGALCHSMTYFRSPEVLAAHAGTSNVLRECSQIKWRDVHRHAWFTSLPPYEQAKLADQYRAFVAPDSFDRIRNAGMTTQLPESMLTGVHITTAMRDRLTNVAFLSILRRCSEHAAQLTVDAIVRDVLAMQAFASAYEQQLTAFANYYIGIVGTQISAAIGRRIIGYAHARVATFTRGIEKMNDAEWAELKAHPERMLPAEQKQQQQQHLAASVVDAQQVFRLVMHVMQDPQHYEAAPDFARLDSEWVIDLDEHEILAAPHGMRPHQFRTRYTDNYQSAVWATTQRVAVDVLLKAVEGEFREDMRVESAAWITARIRESSSVADFIERTKRSDDASVRPLMPRCAHYMDRVRKCANDIVFALCGLASSSYGQLREWRAALQHEHLVDDDGWLPPGDAEAIGLSAWLAYRTRLVEFTQRLDQLTTKELKPMLATLSTPLPSSSSQQQSWDASGIEIEPAQVRLLRMRLPENVHRLYTAPMPFDAAASAAWLTLFGKRKAPQDTVRRLVAVRMMTRIMQHAASGALPQHEELKETKLILPHITDEVERMLLVEVLASLASDLRQVQKVTDQDIEMDTRTTSSSSPSTSTAADGRRRRTSTQASARGSSKSRPRARAQARGRRVDDNSDDDDDDGGPRLKRSNGGSSHAPRTAAAATTAAAAAINQPRSYERGRDLEVQREGGRTGTAGARAGSTGMEKTHGQGTRRPRSRSPSEREAFHAHGSASTSEGAGEQGLHGRRRDSIRPAIERVSKQLTPLGNGDGFGLSAATTASDGSDGDDGREGQSRLILRRGHEDDSDDVEF